MTAISEPEHIWRSLAVAAGTGRVTEETAEAASILYSAAETLSLILPVPTGENGLFVEVGNLLQAGYKSLTLQRADRLASCSQQLPSAGSSRATLSYNAGIQPHSLSGCGQATVIACLHSSDAACMQRTNLQLRQLANGLPAFAGLFATSLQDAAACFLHGYMPACGPRQPLPIAGNSCVPAPPEPEDDMDDEPFVIPLPGGANSLASDPGDEPQPIPAQQQPTSPFLASLRQRSHPKLAAEAAPEQASSKPSADSSHAAAASSSSAGPSPRGKDDPAETVAPQGSSRLLLSFTDSELEKRFELWHNRQVHLADFFYLPVFIYGISALLHGAWHNLKADMPWMWWTLYLPVLPVLMSIINHSWYIKHRSAIQNFIPLYIAVNHAFLIVPAMMLPHNQHEISAQPWASLTRLYPISMHLLPPFLHFVRIRDLLPRHLFICLLGLINLPAAMTLCLPHFGPLAAVALGAVLAAMDFLIPMILVFLIETKLRRSFLHSADARATQGQRLRPVAALGSQATLQQ